ncbi:FAD-dependent monooxygenase [Streptomyces corynorhini]|uniref:Pentachlorophenol monooxygenase n=1 Tax=Streptomyces corynorhini TaxID=2282652 RepID=A0A370B258_9ACTN|nr:FAD-dependent monooxygenase [Streptomyces corynorhini]RDG35920.1 pentachlorophenol monooxygenase [Streptomyces corynorhini]
MQLNDVKERLRQHSDVLIVGAGPTGLALACDLLRRGVSVQVVERADGLFPGSRGKGVQPRTQEVLDDLGVIGEVHAHGGPAPVGMIWKDGVRQGEHRMFDEQEPTVAEPYTGPWLLPQWRMQEILYARLRELGGSVTFGTALSGLAQDPDGVTAELTTGADTGAGAGPDTGAAAAGATAGSGATAFRARYAVAADGGRSTVRRLLGIAMTGESVAPAPMLVADVRVPALDRLNWHIFPADDGSFASLCPLPGTPDFQLVARLKDGAEPDTTPEGVRALLAALTHLTADEVTEVRWSSDFRPRAALADRFRDGRIFLAGDAAHVHSPAGGQGLNTSIQDAYNLGWKLGQVLRHGAAPALLDSYEAERRPVAAEMLGLSTRIHRGEARRGAATRQLGLNYRHGPLSTGAAGALTAGDRAPEGPLPDGTTIFDALRGPHFTLLAVATDADIPPLDEESVRVREAGAYDPYGKGLFLIRPDGYVGWAGDDATGLREWLRSVGVRSPDTTDHGR